MMVDAATTELTAPVGASNTKFEVDWKELVAEKQNQLRDQIPSEWRLSETLLSSLHPSSPNGGHLIETNVPRQSGILSDIELDITENYSAGQLLQKIAAKDVTSLAVTTAFCKRAAIAQQLVNIET